LNGEYFYEVNAEQEGRKKNLQKEEVPYRDFMDIYEKYLRKKIT